MTTYTINSNNVCHYSCFQQQWQCEDPSFPQFPEQQQHYHLPPFVTYNPLTLPEPYHVPLSEWLYATAILGSFPTPHPHQQQQQQQPYKVVEPEVGVYKQEQQQQQLLQWQGEKQEQEYKVEEPPEDIDYDRLTSFLRYDNSFLTPWNWTPREHEEERHDADEPEDEEKTNQTMFNLQEEPWSFFDGEVLEVKPSEQKETISEQQNSRSRSITQVF